MARRKSTGRGISAVAFMNSFSSAGRVPDAPTAPAGDRALGPHLAVAEWIRETPREERPPALVRQIVNRRHVGESNRSVIKYFVSRLRKGAWKLMPREDRKKYLRWVIQAHAENRSLYRMVMGPSR